MEFIFYKFCIPLIVWVAHFVSKGTRNKWLNSIVKLNNKFVLRKNKKPIRKILILLPKCLQYFRCNYDIISLVENCQNCGRCRIKDIIEFKKKYDLEIKVAPGGNLAKMVVKEVSPELTLAVACAPELILGIKDVYPYKVVAIPNIIINKPCVNTDVEVYEIEQIIKTLI